MPAENRNHPDDYAAILRLHQQYVGKIERFSDDLVVFQDEAYALGLVRELQEGSAMILPLLYMAHLIYRGTRP